VRPAFSKPEIGRFSDSRVYMPGALSSLKIVEIGELVSAPYATKLMADMGAEVIKVERPGIGDKARRRGPFPGHSPHPEKSGLYLYLNANKYGVTIDITKPDGMLLLERLVEQADVLIHNVWPPEMDRVRLSYKRMCAINPRLVMTSITPYGLSGPNRNCRAEELTIWSAGGVCVLNGAGPDYPALPPLKTFGSQAGFQGGVHGAVATMGAIIAQIRDGEGQHVDVSVQESLASQLELTFEYWPYMGMIATRLGRKPIQPVESMQCKDGWIYLCCVEEHQWRGFVEVMGNPEWASEEIFADRVKRADNWEALKLFLEDYCSQHTVLELYKKVQEKRVPFAPVSTMGDLINSEHLTARGFFVEIRHPVAGTQTYPGAPLKYHATPWEMRMPAPTLGQHNAQILGGRLGLDQAKLNELRRVGAI
jgi:crotonobetainyl-CoA:carnitine CoA-transferase CaiB-like acyl-CoA transferase